MDNYIFWLVWSPSGASNPTYRHYDEKSANKEAERLALLNPGQEFYVVRALRKKVATSPVDNTELNIKYDKYTPF